MAQHKECNIDELAVEYVRGTVKREELLTRHANRWRGVALGMTMLVASLAWIAGWQEYRRRWMPTHYIAVLKGGNGEFVILLKINVRSKVCAMMSTSKPELVDMLGECAQRRILPVMRD